MSKKPLIFVSSTCYDLKQVRADLKQFIEGLGCEPILSEYDSFPVNPGIGTVDNCLNVVESKASILVLVVGGRYGSTNERGLSVTNLEFRTAKAKGIPVYVFVVRSILEILPVWRQNPSGDFSSVVDSPALFQFVSELRDAGETWVFPFDTAQDICSTLRTPIGLPLW
jgi:hypothetical protein